MKPPPETLDGATVLHWAWSDEPFGILPYSDGGTAARVHGLAICRYPGAGTVYRFTCDADWEVVQDGVYDSIQNAKQQVPEQYRKAPIKWTEATRA